MMSGLEFYFWGSPRIYRDGVLLNFDTRKAVAVLAYLAFHPEGLGRDTVSALLWPEYDQEHARAALRRTLSTLRAAVGAGWEQWFEIEREHIGWRNAASYWVDVDRFHQLVSSRRTHGHPAGKICPVCISNLQEAAALHKGDFLAGFSLRDSPDFDDWQAFQNESLQNELADALQSLVQACEAYGDLENAIGTARQWLSLDPLREEAHRELMRLYSWAGQRPAAIKQYRECARILERELGVLPLEETQQLHQAIVEDRLPPLAVTSEQPTQVSSVSEDPVHSAPAAEEPAYPLVGRAMERVELMEAFAQVGRDGFVVVLEGEPGIGKTRLAQDFLQDEHSRGVMAVFGRCYEGQTGLTYAPLIEGLRAVLGEPGVRERLMGIQENWLVEASRLLPELRSLIPGLPPAAALEGPGAQSLFFEGLRQVLIGIGHGSSPGILILDDLHWMDPATFDFLTYLTRRLTDFPLLIVLTWQEEKGKAQPRLRKLVAETQRSGRSQIIHLNRLQPQDIDELLGVLSTGEVFRQADRERLGRQLYQEAEGLPLFVMEYLAAAKEMQSGETQAWAIPSTIRELIQSRLAGVDATGRQLLSTAAAIGRVFDYDILQPASGRTEVEVITGLEGLLAQGLIREDREEPGESPLYDFSHEKIREIVYQETALVRRRLLHHRIAEALTARWRRDLGAHAGQIAYHYRRSGENQPAATFYQKAGEYARSLYANSQALEHFQAALELGSPDAAALYEAIGDLHTLQGEYSQAIRSYKHAMQSCDAVCRGGIEHKLGNVHDRRGEWDLAEGYYQSASLDLSRQNQQAEIARLLADRSRLAYHRGDLARAWQLAEDALNLASDSQDRFAIAQAQNVLGMVARSQGQFDQAARHLEDSLTIAETSSDLTARIAAMNNLALVYRDSQRLSKAIQTSRLALDLCTQMGDRHRQAALHNNLADLYYSTGQPEAAMEQLKKAVVIFSEVGSESGSLSPEPWKLVEW
jgi:DNA-binding SARP family transcriptional activator/predicted ATPase